jgi:hypothetical protein
MIGQRSGIWLVQPDFSLLPLMVSWPTENRLQQMSEFSWCLSSRILNKDMIRI